MVTFDKIKESKIPSVIPAIVSIGIIINVALWFTIKGSDLWGPVLVSVSKLLPFGDKEVPRNIIAALGMGYYTLQVIGYILDCYWGTIKPQKNIAKLFLFVSFFPQLTTGPISRYSQLENLYEKHAFSYTNITHGAQRILWGLFKKLVLAERVAVIVNGIWGDLATYSGFYHWTVLLLFPIQMYADFSGCMDIVIGVAEIFGIHLPENFKHPFFSRTVQEFWQRWHITLGSWAKDYVLYPLLKSKFLINLGRKIKNIFGKRAGKLIPTAIGMFCLWMVMGIWHGSYKYIIGMSLWYWMILMLGELFSPVLKKYMIKFGFKQMSFSWHLFQSIRTYLIYAVGAVFFRANGIKEAVAFLESLYNMFLDSQNTVLSFLQTDIKNLGITDFDIGIIVISIVLLVVVAVLREKYDYARNWMDQQTIVFRWFVWIGLFIFVLIFGIYGPGYSAAEFIYQGF